MLVLSAEDVTKCLPMKAAIAGMHHAYAACTNGDADMPQRTVMQLGATSNLAIFMPVHIKGFSELALKSVTFSPNNEQLALPVIQAIVQVFDASTGTPVALIDGRQLTAIRTAAGGGASVELLAREESRSLAMLGSGVQARAGIEAACCAREIEVVRLFSPTKGNAQRLAGLLSEKEWCPDIQVVENPDDAVSDADIVWTATTATSPTFSRESVKAGAHIVGIGSFQPSMVEIDPALLGSASIFIDDTEACWAEAGEVIAARDDGLIQVADVTELGEVVLGRHPGRSSQNELTVFKSVGVACQDAVASSSVLEAAQRLGLGTTVDI